jgi:prepilin-type N-terminal cleavage/methylation domain-containing protein
MKKHGGFSLIELLIGLTLASVIMLASFEYIKQALRFLKASSQVMKIERSALLFLHQIEHDLICAIPPLPKEKKAAAKDEKEKDEDKEEKAPAWFEASIDEPEMIDGKKVRLLKTLNFVTTNALTVYNEDKPHYVRIWYELTPQDKREREDIVYILRRHETLDLTRKSFKNDEDAPAQAREKQVTSYDVAHHVKSLSCTFISFEKQKESKKVEKKTHTSWDDKKKLPHSIELSLELYSDDKSKHYSFESLIPILTPKNRDEKPEEAAKKAPSPENKDESQQQAMQAPAQAPASAV